MCGNGVGIGMAVIRLILKRILWVLTQDTIVYSAVVPVTAMHQIVGLSVVATSIPAIAPDTMDFGLREVFRSSLNQVIFSGNMRLLSHSTSKSLHDRTLIFASMNGAMQ
jgi:hypothetical protein